MLGQTGFMVPGPTAYTPPRGFPTCVPADRKALAEYACKRYQTVKGLGATVTDPYAFAPACYVAAMPTCAPTLQRQSSLVMPMPGVVTSVQLPPVLRTDPVPIPPPPAPEPQSKALVVGGILAAALVVGGGYLLYKKSKKSSGGFTQNPRKAPKRKVPRRWFMFFYERGNRLPKEYQGPFQSRDEAGAARDADRSRYGSPASAYKLKQLSDGEFKRLWGVLPQG